MGGDERCIFDKHRIALFPSDMVCASPEAEGWARVMAGEGEGGRAKGMSLGPTMRRCSARSRSWEVGSSSEGVVKDEDREV